MLLPVFLIMSLHSSLYSGGLSPIQSFSSVDDQDVGWSSCSSIHGEKFMYIFIFILLPKSIYDSDLKLSTFTYICKEIKKRECGGVWILDLQTLTRYEKYILSCPIPLLKSKISLKFNKSKYIIWPVSLT